MTIIASQGDTIAMYPFITFDINSSHFVTAKRYATMQTIERLRAVRAGPSVIVPSEAVDEDGFTPIGFRPCRND